MSKNLDASNLRKDTSGYLEVKEVRLQRIAKGISSVSRLASSSAASFPGRNIVGGSGEPL